MVVPFLGARGTRSSQPGCAHGRPRRLPRLPSLCYQNENNLSFRNGLEWGSPAFLLWLFFQPAGPLSPTA